MRKIIIKLPDQRVNKFRLQRTGWKSRRYTTAPGLLNALERSFPRKGFREKTAIVVKEVGRVIKTKNGKESLHFVGANESLDSTDSKYLLYCAICFLEKHLTKETMMQKTKKYLKPVPDDV